MATTEKIRQQLIEECYETAFNKLNECHRTLNSVMEMLENHQNDAELTGDVRYCALASLFGKLEEVKEIFTLKISQMETRKNSCHAAETQPQNEGSAQRDQKECEATEELYVRADLLIRFQNSPLLGRVVMTASEFELLCKTRIGRAYVSAYEWVKSSPQSLFGLHIS